MNVEIKNTIMSASAEMPYFIKPSQSLSASAKRAAYEIAVTAIRANLAGEDNAILKMVTINSILKTHLPYFYWVGFYIMKNGKLTVGPYQGTLGCLHIAVGRGVCGKAAQTHETQLIDDVHQLVQGADHIACDPNSASEIVVPVFNNKQELIAVFDVDSTETGSFDAIDQTYLEDLLQEHFSKGTLSNFSF